MLSRYFLFILFFLLSIQTVDAQELKVKQMSLDANDLSARSFERKDLNDNPCALVKVQLAAKGADFEGNVVGDVTYKTGEYWVYMTEGSRELRIKHPNFLPLHVNFVDHGMKRSGVKGKQTYTLTITMPQTSASAPPQQLNINYTPANAMVLIDSKPFQANGRLEVLLPVGTHEYQLIAMGYETVEGSVKMNGGAPQTITVNMVSTTQDDSQHQNSGIGSGDSQQTGNQQVSVVTDSVGSEIFTLNGASFKMVRVEGGKFQMGATSDQGQYAESDEKPAHEVTLSTFRIGETEVTQAVWLAVMGANPAHFMGNDRPVENVSWDDCQEFIQKLNQLTGRTFRLPTEAEWEYAARGGKKSKGYMYSGSAKATDVAWYTKNTHDSGSREVKTRLPNELGLYDMSGNVWEWCQDWYENYSSKSVKNPTGPTNGTLRVRRGGSWYYEANNCRVSFRISRSPDYSSPDLGLRLALQE